MLRRSNTSSPSTGGGAPADDVVFNTALDDASTAYDAAETGGEDDALLYYTSGTTGLAKGVLHKHRWVAGVAATQKYAVDLQPGDLYWSTGDLGWLAGAINTLGAWFWGASLFTYEGEFDPEEGPSCSTSTRSTSCSRSRRPTGCSVRKIGGTGGCRPRSAPRALDRRTAQRRRRGVGRGRTRRDRPRHIWTDGDGQHDHQQLPDDGGPARLDGQTAPGIEADIVDSETGEVLEPGETGEIAQRGDYPASLPSTGTSRRRRHRVSSTVPTASGTSRATSRIKTKTATSGSRGVLTTLSSPRATGSARSRSSSLGEHEGVAEAAVVPKPHSSEGTS